MLCGIVAQTYAEGNIDQRLKEFAKQKHQQAEELATKLHLDVPAEIREFFQVAEVGDCDSVSNSYERIQRLTGQLGASLRMPGYTNVLNVPIYETRGAYEFCNWDGTLLREYANGILNSIPADSVYFGGTDPGRFVITMFRDTTKSPDIVILTQKFIITQNALVDTRYVEYLRLTSGERLWLPSVGDVQVALQEYGQNLQKRQQRGEQLGPDEQLDATGRPRGVVAVMAVNGILTKMIFDHNKDKHEFYVEESYVIPWMYPYFEPHGLILKLAKEPMHKLDPYTVVHDRQFWDKLAKELLADSKFLANKEARRAYAKLRSTIGGVYAYRKLYDDAAYAYRQSIELCPDSPEANFRLAQLLLQTGQSEKAIELLEAYQKFDPLNPKIVLAIQQIRDMQHPTKTK